MRMPGISMWRIHRFSTRGLAVGLLLSAGVAAMAQGGGVSAASPAAVAMGSLLTGARDDLSQAQRSAIERAVAEYEARTGQVGRRAAAVPMYAFIPFGANVWQDATHVNYVDLDLSQGIEDWDCSEYTYDGHGGHDITVASFKVQAIGVPIFAALDGTVVDAHDGEDDTSTGCLGNPPANYIVIDHGGGLFTYNWHFKKNSVAVAAGQHVVAGEQIGLMGSSGCSSAPHLHFESRVDGKVYEPYAGACHPGESGWADQLPVRRDAYAFGFCFSERDFGDDRGLPWDNAVRTGTFLLGTRTVHFLIQGGNSPANASLGFRFLAPDGSLAADYAWTSPYSTVFSDFWITFGWEVPMEVPGDWHLAVDLGGQPWLDAPFRVVANASEIVNRPPNPVTAAFDPPQPSPDEVLFCRASGDLYRRDPDYDILRYRYRWTINGTVVREITSGGMADAIRRDLVRAGDVIACSVTPSDGALDGPEAKVEVTVAGGPLACSATASVTGGQVPLAVAFSARCSGGTPPYAYEWDFGDGSAVSSERDPSHTFASAGVYNVRLTVRDSAGGEVTDTGLAVTVTANPDAPAVASMTKAGNPFRLKVAGSNFQSGLQVFIAGDTSPWPSVAFASGTNLTIKGGKALKAKAPKGVPTQYRFRNPDGGECLFTYAW